MRFAAALLVVAVSVSAHAIKLDVTFQDVERALVIARSSEAERARFHAPYIRAVNTPFVERVNLVSEFRRIVLLAEEHIAKGDRSFAYSPTRAFDAVSVWRRRLAVRARLRFHPQNVYVTLPDMAVDAEGRPDARIGVLKEPVYGFAPDGTAAPLVGAIVEGVFDAAALGQARREFVVTFEGREVGRAAFELGTLD